MEKAQRNTETNLLKENNMELNEITERIIGSAIEVHKQLGPGLPESAYEECLAYEPREFVFKVER